MRLEDFDAAYLADMLIAARRVQKFMAGMSYEAFAEDEMRSMAVERAFEVIGESAKLLSDDFRRAYPALPVRQMIGLRNIIAHEYAEIDYRLLHRVATADVPELIRLLESLLPDDPERME